MPESEAHEPLRRVGRWQHGRAVRQMLRAYPPGVDALVDDIRARGPLVRFGFERVLLPLYFAREEGWYVPGSAGEMVAIMYLRRQQKAGFRVMHVDDINVDESYRGRGLAQRLMTFAEDLARRERRPFMKLAVTVANTPAVSLYKRLGYLEQQYRYLTYDSASVSATRPHTDGLELRPLSKGQATQVNRDSYRAEIEASDPALGPMMATYYSRGAGGVGVPTAGSLRYAIARREEVVGYWDAYRKRNRWNVRVNLQQEFWGSELERQAVVALTQEVVKASGERNSIPLALHVPSAAHHEALCAGSPSIAADFGMTEQRYDRMIMAKSLGTEP